MLRYTEEDGYVFLWAAAVEDFPLFIHVDGTDGNDRLVGTSSLDTFEGFAGDDRIIARGGNDIAFGNEGNDVLRGGAGNDTLFGDGFPIGTVVQDDDRLFGGTGNDTLQGGIGDDLLSGGAGADILLQGDGDDILRGGRGRDELWDSIGDGNDVLTGGAHADTFNFLFERGIPTEAQTDIVTDFEAGRDALVLTMPGSSGQNSVTGGDARRHLNEEGVEWSVNGNRARFEFEDIYTLIVRFEGDPSGADFWNSFTVFT